MPELYRDLHFPQRRAGKRGKTPARLTQLPALTDNLTDDLPAPTSPFDYGVQVSGGFPMAGNDRVGDCTIAGVIHYIQVVYAVLGQQWAYPGDQAVMQVYSELSGYDPNQIQPDGSNPTDTGLNEIDVIRKWATDGLFGTKAVAAAGVHPNDMVTQQLAVYNFGAGYLGWDLPAIAEQEFEAHEPWQLAPGDNPPVGGHCTISCGWNSIGFNDVTWGAENSYTNNFARYYMEEFHVIILQEMVDAGHGALANVNVSALQQACQRWLDETGE